MDIDRLPIRTFFVALAVAACSSNSATNGATSSTSSTSIAAASSGATGGGGLAPSATTNGSGGSTQGTGGAGGSSANGGGGASCLGDTPITNVVCSDACPGVQDDCTKLQGYGDVRPGIVTAIVQCLSALDATCSPSDESGCITENIAKACPQAESATSCASIVTANACPAPIAGCESFFDALTSAGRMLIIGCMETSKGCGMSDLSVCAAEVE